MVVLVFDLVFLLTILFYFSDKIWVDGVGLRHLGMVGCFIRYQIFRSLLKRKVEMEFGTQWSIIIPFLFCLSVQNCLVYPMFCPQTCSNVRWLSSGRITKKLSTKNWTFITPVRSDTKHSIKTFLIKSPFLYLDSGYSVTSTGGRVRLEIYLYLCQFLLSILMHNFYQFYV